MSGVVQDLVENVRKIENQLDQIENSLEPILKTDEEQALFYSFVAQGLAHVETIQQKLQEIDNLTERRNFLEAVEEVRILYSDSLGANETQTVLEEVGMTERVIINSRSRREEVRQGILESQCDFLFHRRANSQVKDRLMAINDLIKNSRLASRNDLDIFNQKV